MKRDQVLYPDANGSLRVSYGTVRGCEPEDGLSYRYYTTMDGMYDKYLNNPDDLEYFLPKKCGNCTKSRIMAVMLIKRGRLRVCFLTDAHTTSGNSGSAVVNAKESWWVLILIGYGRELLRSFCYDENICRNIVVDIRYILFVLEKYAPFSYVFDEICIE